MDRILPAAGRGAGVMIAFAVVFTALMAGTYALTRDRVRANEETARLALLAQVLPPGSYDNRPLDETRALTAPELGEGERRLFVARRGGTATAVVLEVTAPDGYAGAIDLLVGVRADGRVAGVRVVRHKETPGLGDYIEIAKSAWIRVFDGKSARDPAGAGWRVTKDGGVFAHRAGATVTPRAVVAAVHRAVDYVAAHRRELFEGGRP